MAAIRPTTPTIEIHLAHDDDVSEMEITPLRSPYSPKFPSPMAHSDSDADDYRPFHLAPPPSLSPVRPKMRSAVLPTDKKGIDQERFAELLKNSRERAAMKHGRKESVELRKQVTLKAHTTKALERRALFLSKIQSPPSPTQADQPATPPESPAIFHFTLPSPGMLSPLAVFENLQKSATGRNGNNSVSFPCGPAASDESGRLPAKGWVEEVDFKARVRSNGIIRGTSGPPVPALDLAITHRKQRTHNRSTSAHGLPSLDQITARLAKSGHIAPSNAAPSLSAVGGNKKPDAESTQGRPRLEINLSHRRSPSSPAVTSPVASEKPSVPSRLPPFLQKRVQQETAAPAAPSVPAPAPVPVAVVVSEPAPVQIAVKPVVAPSIVLSSPPHTRRRPSNPPPPPLPPTQPFTPRAVPHRLPLYRDSAASPETRKQRGLDMVEKLRRRSSAPASLPPVANRPQHPVESLKGGF